MTTEVDATKTPETAEAEHRQAVLDKLDKIIELLSTPGSQQIVNTYTPPSAPQPAQGWTCPTCGTFVTLGGQHYCPSYRSGR